MFRYILLLNMTLSQTDQLFLLTLTFNINGLGQTITQPITTDKDELEPTEAMLFLSNHMYVNYFGPPRQFAKGTRK